MRAARITNDNTARHPVGRWGSIGADCRMHEGAGPDTVSHPNRWVTQHPGRANARRPLQSVPPPGRAV